MEVAHMLGDKIKVFRKSKGFTQEELAIRLNIVRQTISKWELAQSYPDFQRLVLLSDYFGLSLDALVKDIDVQDVREKNVNEKKLNEIYDDVKSTKTAVNTIINFFAIFGFVGIMILLFIIFIWG